MGEIETTRGKIPTPVFMPCATKGSVKGISAQELENLDFKIILGNTYHLYLRPGEKVIKKYQGLHNFINWKASILTDSGGFQVFSLGVNYQNGQSEAQLVKIQQDGVVFCSHLDGKKHKFTPEKVIDIQKNLGSDIMMVLDVCTEYPASYKRTKETMALTHQWAKQARDYWQKSKNPNQSLFGIIQGGTYQDLRKQSAKYITNLDFDGLAVGGVSVGEGKTNMKKVIKWLGPILPQNKPHYLMGVGEPEDIIFAVKYGFDMFDCVLPTRLGRHGTIWHTKDWNKFTKMDLRKSEFRQDKKILMAGCQCPSCSSGYTRAYLAHLIKEKEMLGLRLTSLHNLYLLSELMRRLRKSI